jgi:hypothetical protein
MFVGNIPKDLVMDMNGNGSVTSLAVSKILEFIVKKCWR